MIGEIDPTFIYAIAIITGSIIGSFGYQLWMDRRKANRLRKAIKTELESETSGIPLAKALVDEEDWTMGDFPTIEMPITIDNNLDDLGRLTEDEIETLLRFYSLVKGYSNIKINYFGAFDWDETVRGSSMTVKDSVRSTVNGLSDEREKILDKFD